MNSAGRARALLAACGLLLGGCAEVGDLFTGPRGRGAQPPLRPQQADPPASEAGMCDLARQAVREATGVRELRGETCTATRAGPGEWQARVDFAAGSAQQSYRVQLQPNRRGQGWAVVDITPATPSG